MNRKRSWIPLLVVAAAACSSSEQIADPLTPGDPRASLSAETELATLARGLAISMNDTEIRTAVRDGMRDSPLSEHKLDLHDFTRTAEGARVVAGIAHALGTSGEDMQALIARLPPIDFYAPFRQHRVGWQGSRDVIVATPRESNSEDLIAYSTLGIRVPVTRTNGVPREALLVLRPAEIRGVRVGRIDRGQGSTIQRPDEDDLGVVTRTVAPCDLTCEDLYVDPGGVDSGSTGGPVPPSDTTRLAALTINHHWDEWWDDTNEVIVEGGIYLRQSGDNPCRACNRIIYTGVRANQTYHPANTRFLSARVDPAQPEYLYFHLREEDSFVPDDEIGTTYQPGTPLYSPVDTSLNNNGTPTTIYRWTEHEFWHDGSLIWLSGSERGEVTATWTPR